MANLFYDRLTRHRDTDRIFNMLPSSLRVEVAVHISLPLVKQSEVFSHCSSGFTAAVAVLMREVTVAADEIIFRTNDVCNELYIIATGNVNIVNVGPDGQDTVREHLPASLCGGCCRWLPAQLRHHLLCRTFPMHNTFLLVGHDDPRPR